MFSFFHITPKIHMDCFVNNSYIFENVPIVNAHKTYPQWWKDLPLGKREFDYSKIQDNNIVDSIQKNNNMKNCYGFLELYKRGAVVESWTDLRYKVGPAGYKFFCSNSESPSEHGVHQRGEGFKNYHHSKLQNPWMFEVKEDVKFLLMGALWSMENYDFMIPPGVLNFKLTPVCHINILIPKKSYEFEIGMGQPLIHLIPLNDKKVVIHNHLLTEEEYKKKRPEIVSSFYGWRKKMELILRNKERKESKCPFNGND